MTVQPKWTPENPRYGGARSSTRPTFRQDAPPASLGEGRPRPQYGDARRAWHPDFIEYMYAIIENPEYAAMPYALDEEGKTDWIIPTGRSRGSKNWDGNERRREWWRARATEIGIPLEGKWISRTAKAIHPFGQRPCQICGRWMKLAYVYPTAATLRKLNAHLPDDTQLQESDYLDIFEIADHFVTEVGLDATRRAFNEVFRELNLAGDASLDELKDAVDEKYIRRERNLLSPGAMSNPPDRLDGFHTYNRCCRPSQDTGRSSENLKTYGVDRRAFEHWCEGDWAAANQLMKLAGEGTCPRCGAETQMTADHVGPISLGFRHSPSFLAVCGPCNSGQNNRMRLWNLEELLRQEARGQEVISWQARAFWDALKNEVKSDDQALLLSKLMRASQHHFLKKLSEAVDAGVPDVLLQFLSPEQASFRAEFPNLDRSTLQYDPPPALTPRQDTYAKSQGARMVRIAFSSLQEYAAKTARKVHYVDEQIVDDAAQRVARAYEDAAEMASSWRADLNEILSLSEDARDARLAALFEGGYKPVENFTHVREALEQYQQAVATVLVRRFHEGRADRLGDEPLFDEDEVEDSPP